MYWLDNKRFVLFFVELLFEVVWICWQLPGLREKVVLFFEILSHPHQVLSKVVLLRKHSNVWVGIDSLVRAQFLHLFGWNWNVWPPDIPVCVLIWVQLYVHLAANTLYNIVSAVFCAENQLGVWDWRYLQLFRSILLLGIFTCLFN